MVEITCPGSAAVKRPELLLIPCPHCGEEVEIFSDEAKAECEGCGKTVFKEKEPSCFDWCRYAEKCLDAIEENRSGDAQG
jgi:NADH pyrophosphatase NudC (nudix superfamily)